MWRIPKITITTVFLLASHFGWATKSTTYCSEEQLRQKNCLLHLKKGHYQFLKNNLSIDDGVWKGVVPVPLTDENTQWQSLRVFTMANRKFYELKIWTSSLPSVELQSLHWLIVEIDNTSTSTKLDQIIQKRRPVGKGEKKYLLDQMEKHSLRPKSNKIHWSVGHLRGEF